MKIKIIVWQEDNVWCASVPALPGCHTWGESYEHLMEMVKEAIEGWLEVASEQQSPTEQQQLVSHFQLPIKADTYGNLR
jgi:predicted RNase H-like HicB family nuclease